MLTSISATIRALEQRQKALESAIRALRGVRGTGSDSGTRHISEAGRQRIVEAQRKRWAAYRAAKKK